MLPQEKQLTFHLFLDKAVLELYVNGRACITRLIEHDEKNQRVAVFAEGGTAVVKSIDCWEVKSIWSD
jgi:sucrose-6-phosphate hydrolase SacC (GH32 family)